MWLLTLANLLDVDMEDVIKEYLNNPQKTSFKIEQLLVIPFSTRLLRSPFSFSAVSLAKPCAQAKDIAAIEA